MLLVSCTGPGTETERYHRISSDYQPGSGAVSQLQQEAISALEQGSTQAAIEYLQRAIKIDPRNAFSWNYLARAYWYTRNYGRCIDMVERSISYNSANDDLSRANTALQAQCSNE